VIAARVTFRCRAWELRPFPAFQTLACSMDEVWQGEMLVRVTTEKKRMRSWSECFLKGGRVFPLLSGRKWPTIKRSGGPFDLGASCPSCFSWTFLVYVSWPQVVCIQHRLRYLCPITDCCYYCEKISTIKDYVDEGTCNADGTRTLAFLFSDLCLFFCFFVSPCSIRAFPPAAVNVNPHFRRKRGFRNRPGTQSWTFSPITAVRVGFVPLFVLLLSHICFLASVYLVAYDP